MKLYRLLKDIPLYKAGTLFQIKSEAVGALGPVDDDEVLLFTSKDLKAHPEILTEWFEEIKEVKMRKSKTRVSLLNKCEEFLWKELFKSNNGISGREEDRVIDATNLFSECEMSYAKEPEELIEWVVQTHGSVRKFNKHLKKAFKTLYRRFKI